MMAKILKFFANVVRCYVEDDVITVGFGDDDYAPKAYTIITRFDDEEENYSEGEGPIGIQTNLSEIESSSAIASIELKDNFIKIKINERKRTYVGVDEIIIEFEPSKENVDSINKYFHMIFDGSETQIDI
ncbi:hypothetical protein GCM10011611_59030 [Aliidongia dinghuensis]|uniref:Uncharacterized protein n=1 Tax=Aliidongia dinghuensis TaxID=1867774 RepID=A0A8J2YZC3_9PROT|nr:hypothetical protein [Aliidongia dinghuensis]GGF44825.1 hypothetical protein GCM10011611_59030 [Aliidongia dinghuensis]